MAGISIHAFVLAAGESKRFKGVKQLALLKRKTGQNKHIQASESEKPLTLIQRTTEQVSLSRFDSYCVLLGANANQIIPFLQINTHYQVISEWQQGMGITIAKAIKSIPLQSTHVCIVLADQVALTHAHFDLLVAKAMRQPGRIIATSFNNILGAPCIFPRCYFARLSHLSGDKGARKLLIEEKDKVDAVVIDQAIIDIDTPQDLDNFNQQMD